MNTRADRNNARFRQADSAIGRLSGQIQDLNAKVAQLSEGDETTVELLLNTVKTQEQENVILQQQIEKNNKVLIDLSRAHLREATANRQMSDAATFLFQTIVNTLNQSKPFLQQGIGYRWRLSNGLIHLQGVEKQLVNVLGTNGEVIYKNLINETCSHLTAAMQQRNHVEAELKLQQDIAVHLSKARNETRKINATTPETITIHYVPELDNLSLHHSGEMMKEALEKVINHPLDAVEDVGNAVTSFVGDWLKNPLKVILTVGAIIVLAIMRGACFKRGNKKYQNKRQPQVVDMGMIQKLTKPYLLK